MSSEFINFMVVIIPLRLTLRTRWSIAGPPSPRNIQEPPATVVMTPWAEE